MLLEQVFAVHDFLECYSIVGVNLSVHDLLCQDASIQDLCFNISEMKLSITLLFSIQIMSYLKCVSILKRFLQIRMRNMWL